MNRKELISQLLSAVVYTALGFVVTLNPGASANLICSVMGVCALAYGAFCLLFYFIRRHDDNVSRFTLPVGIAFAALGAFCLIAPEIILSVIPLIFGIILLIDGAGKLGRAFEFKRLGFANWGMLVWIAAVVLIFGLMMVTQPFAVLETVMRLFGAVMVADGLIELYMAAKIYKISKR